MLFQVPVPGVRPFPVGIYAASKTETGEQIAVLLSQVRRLANDQGLVVVSLASDSAASERLAQKSTVADPQFPRNDDIVYEFLEYGIVIKAPVFNTSHPLITQPDHLHAAKSSRNFLFGGTKFAIIGNHFITFSILELLVHLPRTPLLSRDIYNADRQDDGSARRLFSAQTLVACTTDESEGEVREELKGFFVFSFVLGLCIDITIDSQSDANLATFKQVNYLTPGRIQSLRISNDQPLPFEPISF